ncbi:MAG: YraN family protein [Hyphomicrobiales bacterium]|nr:YraN family protein [Hyphomicrobiales bacterium]MDZ4790908.1 YraN family protein [Hyphomicrobiales bacterium]
MKAERRKNYKSGVDAEAHAAQTLACNGYTILNRRYKTPAGEIDLVVSRGDELGFVEVKKRRSLEEAAWSITERQQRRIIDAASYWMQNFPDQGAQSITFDAVFVCPGQPPEHVVDAFRLF